MIGRHMNEKEIDDVICKIMMNDGPDGHIDGHKIITGFIMALLAGTGRAWAERYAAGADR